MVHVWHSGQRCKVEQLEDWEAEAITFPPMQTINPSYAPIIIKVHITDCGYNVRRLNIDTGSNVNVMYKHYFRKLPATIKSKMRAPTTAFSGFFGESAWPLGCIELELELFDDDDSTLTQAVPVEFCMVCSYSCYNALLGRVTLQKFSAVPSTVHGMIKFSTRQGIATIQMESGKALYASVTTPKPLPTIDQRIQSSSILVNSKYPDKRIQVVGNLSDEVKIQLRDILVANMDIFAWYEDDMTGVPRNIAEHKLNANPNVTPVRQKKRPMVPERSEWLRLEVEKLVHANILREDINKACPKDNYPLPEIDWKVESLSGFRFKCFLDAYKGYHQIQMAEADEEKTAFHTD
ncbi:uncharacterized protein [Rutidosis leptorrhynchoides]|uniref:uncharacterized protein n=1 Tax=Rutidosis leptorrhynchoides TaxID=125765 RepID=UPI003A997463